MLGRWSLIGIVSATICSGCAPEPTPKQQPASPAKNTTTAPPKEPAKQPKPESGVVVTPIDADGLQAAIAKHAGKVVLIDCWATWCVPCKKAFPHTVEMSTKYADDLAVLSLSFDDPVNGQAPEKVKKFLEEKKATFPHFISTLDIGGEGETAFEVPGGSLPHFKLYDRKGKLIQTFSVEEDAPPDAPELHETVAAAVAEAIEAK